MKMMSGMCMKAAGEKLVRVCYGLYSLFQGVENLSLDTRQCRRYSYAKILGPMELK